MSDTDGKVKVIRNSERDKPAPYKPYIPQYQVHGKDPDEYQGATVPGDTLVARPNADNPRLKRVAIRQPYAPVDTTSPIGRGRGPVPNVGNNMEHTWSTVDADIIDDLTGDPLDPNHSMIDNNEFVTDQALGFRTGPLSTEIQSTPQGKVFIETSVSTTPIVNDQVDDLLSIVNNLSDESYLLIVTGVPVCSGPKEEIQEQASALVFGEHEMCDGNPIPVDDIIILKRIQVKVGLFLE